MTDSQRWFSMVIVLLVAALIYILSPILTPFFAAILLAYFFNPFVELLIDLRLPRVIAVIITFSIVILIILAFFLLLVPLLSQQLTAIIKHIPKFLHWLSYVVWPWLDSHIHFKDNINFEHWQSGVLQHLDTGTKLLNQSWIMLFHSGQALFIVMTNLILIPVLTFYLLCDWEPIVKCMKELLPRNSSDTILMIVNECGKVLRSFFRGQLLVMICLGLIYSAGLWFIGLDVGIFVGVFAGFLSFVPYLGFTVGMLFALSTGFIQFGFVVNLIWIVILFCFGSLIEGYILVPWLVGDRIGINSVAVIFALFAGGKLFGFVGVLLAMPISAIVVVLLKQLRAKYFNSQYYLRKSKS